MIKETSAGGILFLREKDNILYLLLYKEAHLHYKEGWDFSRGLIEKNESAKDGATREIKEETGIEDLKFIDGFEERVKWFYRKNGLPVNKEVIYFLIETKTKDVKISDEHDSFKWCTYDEALKLIKFGNAKSVLKKANEVLNGGLNKFI